MLVAREWCRRRSEIHSLLRRLVADYISPAFFAPESAAAASIKLGDVPNAQRESLFQQVDSIQKNLPLIHLYLIKMYALCIGNC